MDNEQVREWLARNAQEEKGTFNRATIERLLADSDELAKLRAEIAGAPVRRCVEACCDYMEFDLHLGDTGEWATAGETYALLRLPAGESQDTTTRAQGEG